MKGLVLMMAGLASAAAQHPASDMTCAFSQRLKFRSLAMLTPCHAGTLNSELATLTGTLRRAQRDDAHGGRQGIHGHGQLLEPAACRGERRCPAALSLGSLAAICRASGVVLASFL